MKTSNALDFKNKKERKQFIASVEKELIQEYRKRSAEWIGLHIHSMSSIGGNLKWIKVEIDGKVYDWQPDINYNQMAMIEDKLIKKGYEVRYELHSGEMVATIEKWGMSQTIEHNEYFSESDDSDKRIAFMKAFMEYLKSK